MMQSERAAVYANLDNALVALVGVGDNKEKLISRAEWGDISFEELIHEFDTIISIGKTLQELPVEHLPNQILTDLASRVLHSGNVLNRIHKFTLDGDARRTRDQLVSSCRQSADELTTAAMSTVPYLAFKQGGGDHVLGTLREQLDKAEKAVGGTEKAIRAATDEINTLRMQARSHEEGAKKAEANAEKAAAAVAAAQFSESFRNEANALTVSSWRWLCATGVFALATVATAWLFSDLGGLSTEQALAPQSTEQALAPQSTEQAPTLPLQPTGLIRWDLLSNMVNRATILAVLFTGTLWCGRIYRSLVHQATTNRHRALTLDTFKAFVNSTEESHIKDSILLAATRTIFGRAPTGLVSDGTGKDPDVSLAIGPQPAAGAALPTENKIKSQ